jgi:HEPN domain-containing protein
MKRLTARWVRKAEADEEGARRLARARPPLPDLVCFHCQQTAEKYLKALAQEWGLAVPRTHNLDELLNLLLPQEATLLRLRRGLVALSRYAVDYRYPGARATARQAQSALRWAARVSQEVRVRLGIADRRPRRGKSR